MGEMREMLISKWLSLYGTCIYVWEKEWPSVTWCIMFTADDIARIHDLSSDSDASEDEDMVEVPDGKYVCCLVTGAVHILHYLSFEIL